MYLYMNKKTPYSFLLILMGLFVTDVFAESMLPAGADYPYSLPKLTDVAVTGGFWLPRMETNRIVTLKANFARCQETDRIANLTNAAARAWGTHKGAYYNDSDVFKVMEGAAYCLAVRPDAELEKYMTWLIGEVAKAQEYDGYLYTARTLGSPDIRKWARWEYLSHGHELYNMGHMIEAAVAWKEATGRTDFLKVARKAADLMCRTFGYGETQIRETAGHQEIELALCRLYRATGEKRYLELAKFFLDMRGRKDLRNIWGVDMQDHLPVLDQVDAVGHAVRGAYMYSGMLDVAAMLGEKKYSDAASALWEDMVARKMHLIGGIGAKWRVHYPGLGWAYEGFGMPYDLPNEISYLETCAAIANTMWSVRMFRTEGDSKYIDIAERAIYNNVLSGISLKGDEFFYQNRMESAGTNQRFRWTECSCCPVNIVRFIPQIPQFAYAVKDDSAYVNLFIESEAKLKLRSGEIKISQKTQYPWEGNVRISVDDIKTADSGHSAPGFKLNIRVPGWCVGRAVPSDLYTQVVPGSLNDFTLKVNGKAVEVKPVKGYCVLDRRWKKGDVVEVKMNMPVRRIKAHAKVAANRGRAAFERGPVVYCAEGFDNAGRVRNKAVALDAEVTESSCDILGNVFRSFSVPATTIEKSIRGFKKSPATLKLIPYFAWCHRNVGEMQTWFPVEAIPENALPEIKVAYSHCHSSDTARALFDEILPQSSADLSIPRFTFWSHKGTEEYVECSFAEIESVRRVDVYWFNDRTTGGKCHLPESWNVQWRPDKDAPWRRIEGVCPVHDNQFSSFEFPAAVKAQAIRLNIKLQPELSAGILELRIK